MDGELIEVTPKGKAPTKKEKQRFYSMALWLGSRRGYRDGWAANLYRQKFLVWPRGLSKIRQEPDQAFLNYEKSRRIAWVKRQQGAA